MHSEVRDLNAANNQTSQRQQPPLQTQPQSQPQQHRDPGVSTPQNSNYLSTQEKVNQLKHRIMALDNVGINSAKSQGGNFNRAPERMENNRVPDRMDNQRYSAADKDRYKYEINVIEDAQQQNNRPTPTDDTNISMNQHHHQQSQPQQNNNMNMGYNSTLPYPSLGLPNSNMDLMGGGGMDNTINKTRPTTGLFNSKGYISNNTMSNNNNQLFSASKRNQSSSKDNKKYLLLSHENDDMYGGNNNHNNSRVESSYSMGNNTTDNTKPGYNYKRIQSNLSYTNPSQNNNTNLANTNNTHLNLNRPLSSHLREHHSKYNFGGYSEFSTHSENPGLGYGGLSNKYKDDHSYNDMLTNTTSNNNQNLGYNNKPLFSKTSNLLNHGSGTNPPTNFNFNFNLNDPYNNTVKNESPSNNYRKNVQLNNNYGCNYSNTYNNNYNMGNSASKFEHNMQQ